jgi:hypothetical protein
MVYSADLDSKVKPYLAMTDPNGRNLVYDEDFTVRYSLKGEDRTDTLSELIPSAPSAKTTVTVTYFGKGNTEGECKKKVKFDVLPPSGGATDISNAVVTLKKTTYQYTGKPIKPGVKSVILKLSGNEIKLKSSDYKVVYSDNVDIGTMRVTVVGKKKYTGSAYNTECTITPKEVTSLSVTGLKNQTYTGTAVDVQKLPIVVKAGGILLTKDIDYTVKTVSGCEYTDVTTAEIKQAGRQPKIEITLKPASASGKASDQPKVKWSSKAKESKKTVTKSFTIGKAKLSSAAVSFTLSSNYALNNKVMSHDGTKEIGAMRGATAEEKSGKNKFNYVIQSNDGSVTVLEKNADISGAAFLMANGHKIDKNDYTVTVSKTKDGKIGTITYKASKNSKSFSGSRKIKFQYIAKAK